MIEIILASMIVGKVPHQVQVQYLTPNGKIITVVETESK
jgi:hypothetical protein